MYCSEAKDLTTCWINIELSFFFSRNSPNICPKCRNHIQLGIASNAQWRDGFSAGQTSWNAGELCVIFIWQARSRARTKLTQWCNHHVQRLFSNSHFSPVGFHKYYTICNPALGGSGIEGLWPRYIYDEDFGPARPSPSTGFCGFVRLPDKNEGTLSYFNCRQSSVRQLALWGLAKRYVTGPHARLLQPGIFAPN